MGRNRRLLFSVVGSAGDLFPLVPVVRRLRDDGHDVRCAVPRSLALYLRPLDVRICSLGWGTLVAVLDDPACVTTRFDGWSSLRRLVDHHMGQSLPAQVAALEDAVTSWTPDLVVTSPFAAGARIAAHRHRIPWLELSLYPDVTSRLRHATGFCRRYRALCAALADLPPGQDHSRLVSELAWGATEDAVLLHDPALMLDGGLATEGNLPGHLDVVGFPYWDEAAHRPADLDAVERWLDQADTPAVLVTMGSYLGARRSGLWRDVAKAAAALGLRAVFLGPRRELQKVLGDATFDHLIAGYVPLSRVSERVAAVVHHGGIGTTFAALRGGTPAVVVPLAFDQPRNARIVEARGLGLDSRHRPWHEVLERVVTDPAFADRCRATSRALVPGDVATETAVTRILAKAER